MKKGLLVAFAILLVPTLAYGQSVVAPGGVPGKTTYLPQMVVGDGWLTSIFMSNPTSERRQVRVEWFGQDGDAFLQLYDGRLTIVGTYVTNLSENRLDYSRSLTSMDGSLKGGWLKFTQPVNTWGIEETAVSVVFQHVSVDAQVVDASKKLTPVEASRTAAFFGSNSLGLAFCNPNDTPVTVTLTRKSGRTITVSLPPRGQVARFVNELLGEFASEELIELSASAPVAVMPLKMVFDPADGKDKYQAVTVAIPKN